MYLLYLTSIYLTLPYILQTHSSQNTQAYFSCIFKLHVSQKYTYTRSMSNKVSTYNSYTYYKHHISQIYIFLAIPTHLKTYQILFQELITKSLFLWKTYIYNVKSPSYERQKLSILRVILIECNITHI